MPFDSKSARKAGKKSSRKGVPNGMTKQSKRFVIDFLEDDQAEALKDWRKLEPRDRWNVRVRLLEFVVPKLGRIDTTLNIENLTDQEVDEILDRALQKLQDNE